MIRRKTLLSWSTGKDSAWMLHLLRQDLEVELTALFTTVNQVAGRVAMHGVRRELLEAQADAAGLPLWEVPLPWPCANAEYEQAMHRLYERAQSAGVEQIAFGDLFLRDIRCYREAQLRETRLIPVFPLWDLPTPALARDMIRSGLRAALTCVDSRRLPRQFAGREFSTDLLADLPADVDPCGENGEFHTFAYAGPMFQRRIPVRPGEIIERDGFVFADLMAGDER